MAQHSNTHAQHRPQVAAIERSAGARIVGGQDDTSGPGPEIMAADTLEGDPVLNRKGEKLGEIDHVMIDVRAGRVAYAVLSNGGLFGVGDKLFAVPWSAFTLDADRKCFVLDIESERFENAPGFDREQWPSMADNRWAREVHAYFGISQEGVTR
jgi:sporulation protein YlmC with PRC-barrel domain